MDQSQVKVLLFGRMADVVGQRSLPCRADRLLALRDQVFAEAFTAGQVTPDAIRMSVNQVQVAGDQILKEGDEVAFFSVFSGG